MGRKKVTASRDHIQSLARATPLQVIEELVWNALDAGGPGVEVRFKFNKMEGITRIEIADGGTGIPHDELGQAFGSLGNSKKVKQKITNEGRILHGHEGRGRFKALALCPQPEWVTTYRKNGKLFEYSIRIRRDDPEYFDASDPEEASAKRTGTKVILNGVDHGVTSLDTEDTRDRLTQRFALYMSEYPDTKIIYGGTELKVEPLIDRKEKYDLPTEQLGREKATLTVIEWGFKIDGKKLYLCNSSGFSHQDRPAGVQAPGIDYTAYLCSPEMDEWHESGRLALTDLDDDIRKVVELAKDQLRAHVRDRLAEEAQDVVEEWKRLEVYPYRQVETTGPIEQAERQVFDIVAVRVNEQHPTFRHSDTDNKRLTLALIKQSLESNPSSLTTILRDVVRLPEQEQQAFAELLERTPLSSLIKAGRNVTDRLDTLQAFEHILFDGDWKKRLLERTQLHRLLVHELWILGEEYVLGTDDEGLRAVLKKHIKVLGREELAPEVDVKQIDGRDGIPDLMLHRRRKVDRSLFEHLVVELKRPRDPLGQKELGQIENYAFTVIEDNRFNTDKVRWAFVLLGNEIDDYVKHRASTDTLPEGCVHQKGNVSIWVRPWADVLANARARYEFFREQLQIEAKAGKGLELLKDKYSHLLEGRGVRKQKDLEITAGHKHRGPHARKDAKAGKSKAG